MGSSLKEWGQLQKTSQPDEVREVGVSDGIGVDEELGEELGLEEGDAEGDEGGGEEGGGDEGGGEEEGEPERDGDGVGETDGVGLGGRCEFPGVAALVMAPVNRIAVPSMTTAVRA